MQLVLKNFTGELSSTTIKLWEKTEEVIEHYRMVPTLAYANSLLCFQVSDIYIGGATKTG